MSVANSPKTEKNGSRNFIDIAKECAQIPMRHRRCKKDELSILKEKEINIPRTTRRAKITIDLLLQARAKNGPEDAVASEMIKQLPREKINIITKCFQERFMSQMEAPNSWKIVKLVFLRKTRRGTDERDHKLQGHSVDISDVEVVRGVHFPSFGKRKRTWKLEEFTRGRH